MKRSGIETDLRWMKCDNLNQMYLTVLLFLVFELEQYKSVVFFIFIFYQDSLCAVKRKDKEASMLSSLCHIWWICGCVESFALVLKWGGPGVRRKGLPQAPAAVWWSVTGSFTQPTGTQTTLWSVSISDPPGWEKSAQNLFFIYVPDTHIQKYLILKSLHARFICSLFLCLAVKKLISVALHHDSRMIFIGRSMLVFSCIGPISFWVTEVLTLI